MTHSTKEVEEIRCSRCNSPFLPNHWMFSNNGKHYHSGCLRKTPLAIAQMIESINLQHHHQLQKARAEAVKPYQDGIKQIAKDLRETGFKQTADIVERDLAVLDARYHSELDQPTV